jgi:hypothetical protein
MVVVRLRYLCAGHCENNILLRISVLLEWNNFLVWSFDIFCKPLPCGSLRIVEEDMCTFFQARYQSRHLRPKQGGHAIIAWWL